MSCFLLGVKAVKLLLRERSWWLVDPLGIRVTFFVRSVGIVLIHSRSLWRKRDMLGVWVALRGGFRVSVRSVRNR